MSKIKLIFTVLVLSLGTFGFAQWFKVDMARMQKFDYDGYLISNTVASIDVDSSDTMRFQDWQTTTTSLYNLYHSPYLGNYTADDFLTSSTVVSAGTFGSVVKVAKDGTGDYTTIQAAVDSITDSSSSNPYTILIYPGVYDLGTQSCIIVDEPNITLRGISRESCIIQGAFNRAAGGFNDRAIINLVTYNNVIENLTIKNTFTHVSGSAEIAIATVAGGGVIRNCDLYGGRDTVFHYQTGSTLKIYNSYVYGLYDVVSNECDIEVYNCIMEATSPNQGVVWCQGVTGDKTSLYKDCKFIGTDSTMHMVQLKGDATIKIQNCLLNDNIKDDPFIITDTDPVNVCYLLGNNNGTFVAETGLTVTKEPLQESDFYKVFIESPTVGTSNQLVAYNSTSKEIEILPTPSPSPTPTATPTASPTASPTPVSAVIGNVITVAKDGTGDYTTIQGAVDSITDASEMTPALVLVYPGTYAEQVTLKDYVSLIGYGDNFTSRIVYDVAGNGNDPATWLVALTKGNLENLYIENTHVGYSSTAAGISSGNGNIKNCIFKSAGQDTLCFSASSGTIEDCQCICTVSTGGVADSLSIFNSSCIVKNCIITATAQGSALWLGASNGSYSPKFYECTFLENLNKGTRLQDTTTMTPYFFNCRFLKTDMTPSIMIRNESYGSNTTIYHQGCTYSSKGEDACTYVDISSGDSRALSYTTAGALTSGSINTGLISGGSLSVAGHTDNAITIINDASNYGFNIDYSTLALNWTDDSLNYDTTLYRSSESTLKTDGAFEANTAAITGGLTAGGGKFSVADTGNITKINNVTTSFPNAQGSANTYLKNDGSGNWSWSTVSAEASAHNDTTGKQGGTTGEYYHLNATTYGDLTASGTQLADLRTTGTPTFANTKITSGGYVGIDGSNARIVITNNGSADKIQISDASVGIGMTPDTDYDLTLLRRLKMYQGYEKYYSAIGSAKGNVNSYNIESHVHNNGEARCTTYDEGLCAGLPNAWFPNANTNATHLQCLADGISCYFEIPFYDGSVLDKVNILWEAQGDNDGVKIRVLKRSDSATAWTVIGSQQTYTDSSSPYAITNSQYDFANETFSNKYVYILEVESEVASTGVNLYSVGIEMLTLVY